MGAMTSVWRGSEGSPIRAAGLALAVAAALWGPGARAEEGKPLDCVHHRTEARYSGYGYDHLVHLDNTCAQAMACEVSTDANPEKQRVTVKGREKATVVTFRGSPAREFHATVECTEAG